MLEDEESGISIIFARPRKESGSLVLTIPKYVCDKLKIKEGSRLHLILYRSFVVLKHREKIDYEREPAPKILELLDKVFELFRELRALERQNRYYDPRVGEIHRTLKEITSKILEILKQEKWVPEAVHFIGELQNVDELLDALHTFYNEHYEE